MTNNSDKPHSLKNRILNGVVYPLEKKWVHETTNFKASSSEITEVTEFVKPAYKVGLVIIASMVLIFGVWGGLAPLDSAAIAQGTIVPESNKKTIQHLEGGVIANIFVKEGEHVSAGQKLIDLNASSTKARLNITLQQLNTAKAIENRLQAEWDQKDSVDFSNLIDMAEHDPELQKVLDRQQELFKARRELLRGQMEALQQRVVQYQEQIDGLKAQQKATDEQLDVARQDLATSEGLFEKGLDTKTRLSERRRQVSVFEGQKGDLISKVATAREAITESKLQILNLKNDFRKEVAKEQRENQSQLTDLQEQLRAAQDVESRTVIRAPQSGVVTGLKYHTIGGVIQPGAPIMDIVPEGDKLIVEAQLSPQDIDIVYINLSARVYLSAYKSRLSPNVDGIVTYVSADRFQDEKTGMPYYLIKVEFDPASLAALPPEITLSPGMPAQVFIKTGTRTLLDYLINPISSSLRKTFREQ